MFGGVIERWNHERCEVIACVLDEHLLRDLDVAYRVL